MTELNVLFFAILFKTFCVCAAIFGAAFLAYHGKDGWGWLIFLAVILGSTSYKYTKDDAVKNAVQQEKSNDQHTI
jgi:hypothetical protein